MVIIETSVFTKQITALMDDADYRALQEALINRPEMGALIKQGGGLRKVRWSLDGRGKSGGVRIIYYWMTKNEQIYMLYAFPKNVQENLTDAQVKLLSQLVERWS